MTLYRVLITPWVATPHSSRWLLVFVLVLVALGDGLAHIYGVGERVRVLNAVTVAIANGSCWLLLLPNGMVLALAARRLRVPRISRDVGWSLPLYAALGIGVPMLCQFPQGHVLSFAVVQVLVSVGAMLYLVLPAYLGLAMCMLPVLFNSARHVFSLPGLTDPRFVPWGGALILVLLATLAWRWQRLLRGDYAERGWLAPNLINLRRNRGAAQSDPLTDAGSMRVRPDWLLARPDLRHVGPQAPVKSLRIALGGVYLPQTIIGRLYQWIPAALMIAFGALIFLVTTLDDHDGSHLLHDVFSREGFVAMSWMFAVFSLMAVMMPVELLILRWRRPNAELSLLALLPGLGEAADCKRLLLRAALGRPASRLILLLLIGWLGAASLGAGWPVALAMLVVVLGCLGYLCAMALSIFGGRMLSGFSRSLLMIGMFVLLSLTVLAPQVRDGLPAPVVAGADDGLVAAWLALAGLLCWLARRGASALRRRPHPFMPE